MIVSAVRTPFGRLGGGLAGYEATQLGCVRDRAALERIGLEPHEPQYAIMGQVLQGGSRPGARAAGRDRRRPAEGDACRHDQQGLRVVDPRDRDRRLDDPCRRRRRRRHRRHGVDEQRALPPQEGAVRLPPRRRRPDRLDGLRRAHVDLRPAAHGLPELEGRARARHLARAAGRVGRALAGTRSGRAGRRALRRRDRRRRRRRLPTSRSAATRRSRSSPR